MSIAAVCVKRPVFAVMLISFLLVLGIFSFRDLGVDLFPRADPATVTINVQLLGATAEEVSTQVILPPAIAKDDPDSDPVLSVLIAGGRDLRETTEIADKQIKRALATVNGVGEVALTGGRLRQIRIFADAEKLNGFGVTIDQLEHAIQNQNVEVPGGTIRRGASEMGVRTLGRV